eukprot:2895764-Prymnesium_polylepis.1
MLGAMFSGRHETPPDDEGFVFIDRDGKHFRIILNFLRTGVLDVPESELAAVELKRELDYYQLPSEGLKPVSGARILETVITHGKTASEVQDEHKRNVEAKLRANLQLKILSCHPYGHSNNGLTTVLVTPDALPCHP